MKNLFKYMLVVFSLTMIGCAHSGEHREKKCCDKKKMKHAHHEKMWEKLDTDKDGMVSRKEFDAKHDDMFTKMDTNKDGKLSKEEMKAGHHHHKKGKKKGCCK